MSITDLIVSRKKYGITEKKKAELDLLSNEVLDTQYDVEQYQAIVTSLTEKSERFQGYLAVAQANRDQALSNKNLLEEIIQSIHDLKLNSNIAFDEVVEADNKMKEVSKEIKKVVDELIYSAQVMNKLSNIIIRKKGKNPLISDDLIDMVNQAGKDINNAVALALVALNSTYAAEAISMESEAALALEYRQSIELYEILRGRTNCSEDDGIVNTKTYKDSLEYLIKTIYLNTKKDYAKALKASKEADGQLNQAQIKLNKAQIKLSSLQAGLAAANAAAFAS